MSFAMLSALLAFAFVATVTPVPNNLMLMTSGANFGFRRTLPHMLGIVGGVSIMALLVGAGLMALFDAVPALNLVLKVVSVGYLLWLAFKIGTAAPVEERDADNHPMTVLQAATFQWVNPKGWSMALTAISVYSSGSSWWELAIIAAIFTLANLPSVTFWTAAGKQLQHWLTTPVRIKSFNYGMAGLLLASTIPML